MSIIKDKMVSVIYELKYDDAEAELVEKVEKENPLTFLFGAGRMLEHFEKNLDGLKEGDAFDFKLSAEQAYGAVTEEAVVEVPLQAFEVEGKVDEAEVGKIKNGTVLEVSLGAIEKKKYPAKLNFIAPKGTEENGAVQFKIKGDVTLDDEFFVRAGYSANADIVLEKKDSVLSIKEALLQFDKKTELPYVEIKTGDQQFERRDVELGISDGINVEILSGVTINDEIKIWNKTSKKEEDEENN